MKHVIFVWIPIILFMLFLVASAVIDYPIPFDGAIMLLGSSIAGYAGFKSLGVFQSAKVLPSGEGVTEETRKKLLYILVAMYVIILEALIVQYIKPEAILPLDDLFTMAGICSGIVLGGNQAIKHAEKHNGA